MACELRDSTGGTTFICDGLKVVARSETRVPLRSPDLVLPGGYTLDLGGGVLEDTERVEIQKLVDVGWDWRSYHPGEPLLSPDSNWLIVPIWHEKIIHFAALLVWDLTVLRESGRLGAADELSARELAVFGIQHLSRTRVHDSPFLDVTFDETRNELVALDSWMISRWSWPDRARLDPIPRPDMPSN